MIRTRLRAALAAAVVASCVAPLPIVAPATAREPAPKSTRDDAKPSDGKSIDVKAADPRPDEVEEAPRGADASAGRVRHGPCRPIEAEGERYTVCTIDLRLERVRLFWLAGDGLPYASLSSLAHAQGSRLSFAMNAGMYDRGQAPVGLYIENGREMKGVSTANGPGNFHLKPNGVFFVKGDRAGVTETGRYLRARLKPDFATQSGPMLVIDGAVHPKITQEGPSQKIRNGVGVRDDGRVAVFAISERPVSFGPFARLFRDDLGCRNALFLDGSVSSLYAPGLGRSDLSRPLGPLVGAVDR